MISRSNCLIALFAAAAAAAALHITVPAACQTVDPPGILVDGPLAFPLQPIPNRAEAGRTAPPEASRAIAVLETIPAGATQSSKAGKALDELFGLQDRFTRAGRLDDALAVRDAVDAYRQRMAGVLNGPSSLTEYRGQTGRVLLFAVTGASEGSVWGSGIYTDDSTLAAAAVHAGLLEPGQRGVVRVTLFAGRDSYESSDRNGVASREYGAWDGSYVVEAAAGFVESRKRTAPRGAAAIAAAIETGWRNEDELQQRIEALRRLQRSSSSAGRLDEALAIRALIVEVLDRKMGARPDPGTLTTFRGNDGESYYFDITGRTGGTVWGSGTYTDDSDLGTAAVHAGVLRPGQRAMVKVTILPGLRSYSSSNRNGVTTHEYAAWEGSYSVQLVTSY